MTVAHAFVSGFMAGAATLALSVLCLKMWARRQRRIERETSIEWNEQYDR